MQSSNELGTAIYVGGFELPDRNAAAHRVVANAKILRDLGFRVVLLGTRRGDECHSDLTRGEDVQGFESWSVPYPGTLRQWARYLASTAALQYVREQHPDVRLVVCYNLQAVVLARLLLTLRRRRVKVVCDCTEWYEATQGGFLRSMIKLVDVFWRMRVLQKAADGVICISRFLEEYYRAHVHTIRIPPLIDLAERKWSDEGRRPAIGEPISLVYAGSPGASKDSLSEAVRALAELQQPMHLDIVGITRGGYLSANVDDAAFIDRLGSSICFHGRVTHSESVSLLKGADYAIFLRRCTRSNRAGFPTKFVESVACGTPVITTSCSDVPEYVRNGIDGFVLDSSDELPRLLASIADAEIRLTERVDPSRFCYGNYLEPMRSFLASIGVETPPGSLARPDST